jgi:hypothetical protein
MILKYNINCWKISHIYKIIISRPVYLVANVTNLFGIDGFLKVPIFILEIKLGFGFSFGSVYLGLKLMINPWF